MLKLPLLSILFCCWTFSYRCCGAEDDRDRVQQHPRNLFLLRRSCRRKVIDCRTQVEFDTPPFDEWMEGLPKDDAIYQLLVSAKTVDMTFFVRNAKIQDRSALRKLRRVAKEITTGMERRPDEMSNSGEIAIFDKSSLVDLVESGSAVFGATFENIGSFLQTLLTILLLPLAAPIGVTVFCALNGNSLCEVIAAAVTFVIAILYLPIWLPAFVLMRMLSNFFGLDDFRLCYSELLRCHFDSLLSKAIPFLLLEGAGSVTRNDGPSP